MTFWLWMVFPPLILLMGTFGNLATVGILSRLATGGGGGGGSTMTMYLLALAASDLVVLYAGLFRYWLIETFQLDIFSWHSVLCKLGMWAYGAAWNNATYLLVALTLQRTLSVLWPHRIRVICTRTTTKAVIGGITLTSCLLLSHVLYGYDVVVTVNGTAGMCGHGSFDYYAFNAGTWVFVEIVTFALLPFVCMIVSNGILAWKLVTSLREAKLSLAAGGSSGQVESRKKKMSSATVTVMMMSFVFILLNLPLFVLLIMNSSNHLDAPQGSEEEFGDLDNFVQGFVMLLVLGNSAVNFYLYCLTGTRFREEMKNWCCGVCSRVRSRGALASGVVVNADKLQDTGDEF
ncbi:hypothetical protein ACOMHN_034864 [Nucella lapillus]